MSDNDDDRRSVHTDALATLGTIIGPAEARDAIHLAVEPTTAGMALQPGARVALGRDGRAWLASHIGGRVLGIVDPFLTDSVTEGQRFWLVVLPRTITSLRHVWSHPDFGEPVSAEAKAKSLAWLEAFAGRSACPGVHELLVLAMDHQLDGWREGDSLRVGGQQAEGDIPDEFWDHAEVVTGVKMNRRAEYFSCSC